MSNRRGHLSRKVPNVKLKPKPKPVSLSQFDNNININNDDNDDDENNHNDDDQLNDNNEKPLVGFVVCSTGIMNRNDLFNKASEMGAKSESNFTSSVTHLLAIDFGSEKYNCAVKLKIPVLKPSFIETAYLEWIEGHNINIESLIYQHKLKPFDNLTISLSGVEQGQVRKDIEKSLIVNNAHLSRDLHKQCTHLVTTQISSAKVNWAKNYNKNSNNHIHIVWLDWINACVHYDGRLPEFEFSIDKPKPDPLNYMPKDSQNSNHILLAQDSTNSFSQQQQLNKKRSAVIEQSDDLERAVIKKQRLDKKSLVDGILSQTSNNKLKNNGYNNSIDTSTSFFKDDNDSINMNGVIPDDNKDNSFGQPLQSLLPTDESKGYHNNNENESDSTKIFNNYTFSHRGFEKSKSHKLEIELEKLGATVTHSVNLADMTIVPFNSGSNYSKDIPSLVITECWIERCMWEGKIVPYNQSPLFKPIDLPSLSDSIKSSFTFTFSGIDECERTQIIRLFKNLGIETKLGFPKSVSHLITITPPKGKRYERALEWKLPVVDVEWVWQITKQNSIPPIENYYWSNISNINNDNKTSIINESDVSLKVDNSSSDILPPSSLSPVKLPNNDMNQNKNIKPLRKTISSNPFKKVNHDSKLHQSILQLLNDNGGGVYDNGNSKGKSTRPRLKRSYEENNNSHVEDEELKVNENGRSLSSTPSPPPPPPTFSQQIPSSSQGNNNESLRILYDDPAARNERKRILQAISSNHDNNTDTNSSSNNINDLDDMYKFANEEFEKPIADSRPRRHAARASNDKTQNQYDPTQLDEF